MGAQSDLAGCSPGVRPPSTLVLCSAGSKLAAFVAHGNGSSEMGTLNHLLKDREQSAIVIDLQTRTLSFTTPNSRKP